MFMTKHNKLSYIRAAMGIVHGNRTFGGPIQVSLNLTNRCNIRCIHCFFIRRTLKAETCYFCEDKNR